MLCLSNKVTLLIFGVNITHFIIYAIYIKIVSFIYWESGIFENVKYDSTYKNKMYRVKYNLL